MQAKKYIMYNSSLSCKITALQTEPSGQNLKHTPPTPPHQYEKLAMQLSQTWAVTVKLRHTANRRLCSTRTMESTQPPWQRCTNPGRLVN